MTSSTRHDPEERRSIHEEIAAFAAARAGTEVDLDKNLEQAGLEALEKEAEEG